VKRYTTEIVARDMQMLDTKAAGAQPPIPQEPPSPSDMPEEKEEDLPF